MMIRELHPRLERRLGRRSIGYEDGAFEAVASYPWRKLDDVESTLESLIGGTPSNEITCSAVAMALADLAAPLDRIDQERYRAERKQLIELYRKHGTYSGVARELGITRNAAKYRLARHDLLPRPYARIDRAEPR